MTTLGFQQRREPERPAAETAQQRATRLAKEAAMLQLAYADIEAGRVIADDELDAWLDDWVSGKEVSLPEGPSPSSPKF